MEISQKFWSKATNWKNETETHLGDEAELVFVFGGLAELEEKERYTELKDFYPNAEIVLCSTAGEIINTRVCDNHIVATAIRFNKTKLKTSRINIAEVNSSIEAGRNIASTLSNRDLVNVLVISDGQLVNGTELVEGLTGVLHKDVLVTGGMAADAGQFKKTVVGLNKTPIEGEIVIIGFYGKNLKVGHGSRGGWDPFGPVRLITKTDKNVLYELDGQNALDLYKKYLGKQADQLPGSALLFPLSIWNDDNDIPVVRTILSISEKDKSLTFAGNMPIGGKARFMRANFDRLIDGAILAANYSLESLQNSTPDLAILISCVGRKLVLNQRIEEEIEEVQGVLGDEPIICGFYSNGEISPFVSSTKCLLHNQTMTITTFKEF